MVKMQKSRMQRCIEVNVKKIVEEHQEVLRTMKSQKNQIIVVSEKVQKEPICR